jgi:aspartate/methionine/tyrosine aminotransferase
MFAERNRLIQPFRVMVLMERARQLEREGRVIVHLEVGEPDFPTAEPIVTAGHQALVEGRTGYTEALGIPELRLRIADFYRDRSDIEIDPGRIVVTSGASGALVLACTLLADPGDGWLMTDPGYPCNRSFVAMVNAQVQLAPVGPDSGYQMNARIAAAHWRDNTRGLLLASPSNPTGAMLRGQDLEALFTLASERGASVILDEIYQGLTYGGGDGHRGTALTLSGAADLYVVNSFSKYFGMTGWRLGWMVIPADAVAPLSRLAQNLFISPPSISQYAALAAFSEEALAEHERRRQTFEARRDLLVSGLEGLGLQIALVPEGAFYLYVDISTCSMSSEDFCSRLLEDYGVAVTPGTDFGAHRSDCHVRFAFTTGEDEIRRGLERIGDALTDWGIR